MNEPSISRADAERVVEQKTSPRVTKESIEAKIGSVRYTNDDILTICVISMQSGFKVVGKAAPASAANYDKKVGERYAYDDAFRQLWPLEGYLLCSTMTGK